MDIRKCKETSLGCCSAHSLQGRAQAEFEARLSKLQQHGYWPCKALMLAGEATVSTDMSSRIIKAAYREQQQRMPPVPPATAQSSHRHYNCSCTTVLINNRQGSVPAAMMLAHRITCPHPVQHASQGRKQQNVTKHQLGNQCLTCCVLQAKPRCCIIGAPAHTRRCVSC